jgi:hypothetical protein
MTGSGVRATSTHGVNMKVADIGAVTIGSRGNYGEISLIELKPGSLAGFLSRRN